MTEANSEIVFLNDQPTVVFEIQVPGQNIESDSLSVFSPSDIKLELSNGTLMSAPLFDASMMSECSFSDDSNQADLSPGPGGSSNGAGGGKMRKSGIGQKHGLKGDKLCAVCGDKALGCNFDAISCESCKAFFRRNAFKEMKMKCLFDGHCKIDVNTRRFCPFCRLKQCFTVGMKKELILDLDEKKRRMEKVIQNREKRQSGGGGRSSANDVPLVSLIEVNPPSLSAVSSPQSAHGSLSPVASIGSLAAMQTNAAASGVSLQAESTNLLILSHLPGVAVNAANEQDLVSSVTVSQSMDSQLVRRLTPEESHMLHELNQVYDLSFTVDLEPLVHITQLDPSLNQLVNQSSITVLRLIKFAKRLDEFVRLSQACQISILKGCWIHMLLLRSVSLYDVDRDVWCTPRGDIPTEILKNATGYVELHDNHIRYCQSMKSIIGNDLTIVVILQVLVLFAPDGPHVIMRELISNIQDRYLILLKHYLEAKYTYQRSAQMFPQLMTKMQELNALAEVHNQILLDVNPQEIEPIMLEILDLK